MIVIIIRIGLRATLGVLVVEVIGLVVEQQWNAVCVTQCDAIVQRATAVLVGRVTRRSQLQQALHIRHVTS
jgi:hypothetical protein